MSKLFELAKLNLVNIIDEDTEFIPLLSADDEKQMNEEELPKILSVLPLKNTVLFPGVVIPITVNRDKSIKLIKDAYKGSKVIGVVAQKDSNVEDPTADDLYKVGTVAHIIKILQMPDGNTTAILQGKKRFQMNKVITVEPYITATVKPYETEIPINNNEDEQNALIESIKELALQII